MNLAAMGCYAKHWDEHRIANGIACFDSLEDALADAEENIERCTRRDFPMAWFYEAVRAEVLRQMSVRVTCGVLGSEPD